VRKIEINRKKKRLWKINIEFKGERYVSDMEQKYSLTNLRHFTQKTIKRTAQWLLHRTVYALISMKSLRERKRQKKPTFPVLPLQHILFSKVDSKKNAQKIPLANTTHCVATS
jgi:hypothetical protein